jgi:hypothetical protein
MTDEASCIVGGALIVAVVAAISLLGWLILASLHIQYYGLMAGALLWMVAVVATIGVMAWLARKDIGGLGSLLAAVVLIGMVIWEFHALSIYHAHLYSWCAAHHFGPGQQLYYHCPATR